MSHLGASQAIAPAEALPVIPSAPVGTFDEVYRPDGTVRPAWTALLAAGTALGQGGLSLRAADARRVLREHGVTCFVSDGGPGQDQPWELDPLPFLITAEEWRGLKAGLAQRATLLNLLLRDLYGMQRLLRNGLVPAPLVFANPGYLRACQGVRPPLDRHLLSYAADLARSPDGTWWVLADRTQVPGGIGFALENRTVISRVFPEAVEALKPQPLTGTLRRRRDALQRLAPQNQDNPAIVLLSPGPRNEAYYEHSYLARLQGYTLVEGGDLTVRNRRVYLKTLEGLRDVDVILRRVADHFCDPLELRGDSLLGVPGLVEATRAGQVSVANTLGSGLLESPAFLAFLPALCRHLLGEELRLPSVATWWCGQGYELNYVRENFERLVVAPAFSLTTRPGHGAELDPATARRFQAELHTSPHEWVGQEEVVLSQAPVLAGDGWISGPAVLRAFVVFDGEEYRAMPGGLVRLLQRERLGTARLSLAGPTKDVWVLPSEGLADLPVTVRTRTALRQPASSDLPSRTADALYWLGRYAERLEQLVRATRGVLRSLEDAAGAAGERRLRALGGLMEDLGILSVAAEETPIHDALLREALRVIHQPERKPGVAELLGRIQQVAFSARDRFSADTWRLLNRIGTDSIEAPEHLPLFRASSGLNRLVLDLAALSGMENENMTRGHGWRFLGLGRRLERGISIARLLGATLQNPEAVPLLLEPLLEIADSAMTYRRQYFIEPTLPGVLRLLLLDRSNPRSLAFQLEALEALTAAIPSGANPEGVAQIRDKARGLVRTVQSPWPGATPGTAPERAVEALRQLGGDLGGFSDLVTRVYFSHVEPRVD